MLGFPGTFRLNATVPLAGPRRDQLVVRRDVRRRRVVDHPLAVLTRGLSRASQAATIARLSCFSVSVPTAEARVWFIHASTIGAPRARTLLGRQGQDGAWIEREPDQDLSSRRRLGFSILGEIPQWKSLSRTDSQVWKNDVSPGFR